MRGEPYKSSGDWSADSPSICKKNMHMLMLSVIPIYTTGKLVTFCTVKIQDEQWW